MTEQLATPVRRALEILGDDLVQATVARLRSGSATESVLADHLGVTRPTVHVKLAELEGVGIVDVVGTVRQGRGAPARVWALTSSVDVLDGFHRQCLDFVEALTKRKFERLADRPGLRLVTEPTD